VGVREGGGEFAEGGGVGGSRGRVGRGGVGRNRGDEGG